MTPDGQPAESPFPIALFNGPPHHIAYKVSDLEQAILYSVGTLGVGPFFVLRDVPLTASSRGEPVSFEHSTAFGQWGSLRLELMRIDSCGAEHVKAAIGSTTPSLDHLGWAVPSLASTGKMLDDAELPAFLHARVGDIEFAMHDARRLYGHNIEVHADSEGFRAFFRQVHEASIDWDGRDPIRELDQ